MRKAVFGEMRGLKGIVVLAVVVAVMSVLAVGPVLAQGKPACDEFGLNQKACVPVCPETSERHSPLLITNGIPDPDGTNDCVVNSPNPQLAGI